MLQWGDNWRHEGDPGVPEAHPYYESHRSEMQASMRMRLDLIDDLLQQHLSLTDTAPVKSDMMQEFEVVLTQMPYVGGAESRMSDFFMRRDRGRQTQVGRQIGGDSRSGWNFLIKIGYAGGALESVSIRIILFVCCNPNKPNQGAARRTDRSFYRPFWKRNRTERRHGRSRSLGCAGRMPTRDAALTLRMLAFWSWCASSRPTVK